MPRLRAHVLTDFHPFGQIITMGKMNVWRARSRSSAYLTGHGSDLW